jgi:hypothetical protein
MAEDLTARVSQLEITLGHTIKQVEALKADLLALSKALLVFAQDGIKATAQPNGDDP